MQIKASDALRTHNLNVSRTCACGKGKHISESIFSLSSESFQLARSMDFFFF